jgi:prophage antirepressor-like protein
MINEKLGEVRVIRSEDGNVMNTLFCALDVARALMYTENSIRNAINSHCRYVSKIHVHHPQNPDKTISINFIPLCDVFSLIYGSCKEEAEEFRRWINEDVLPQLYQFGTYTVKDYIPDLPLGNP